MSHGNESSSHIGVGIYAPREVARYVHTQTQQIRRWFGAYSEFEALWTPQLPRMNEDVALGFLDLIEVRLVRQLRLRKVSLQTIRRCIRRAQEITEESHPFATRTIKTDGKSLFLELTRDRGDKDLLNLVNQQWGFQKVIEQSLQNVEFAFDGTASKWFPAGKRSVVLDPLRNFGQPTLEEYGVPTSAIIRAYEVEESVEKVAWLFEIPEKAAYDAINFETRIAA